MFHYGLYFLVQVKSTKGEPKAERFLTLFFQCRYYWGLRKNLVNRPVDISIGKIRSKNFSAMGYTYHAFNLDYLICRLLRGESVFFKYFLLFTIKF